MSKDKISVLVKMSAAEQIEYIKSAMGYKVLAKPPKYWLDTGSRYLNKVFGSKRLGMAYGKIYLLAGKPSSGKSALAAKLAALAQADGASVGWGDPENSFDPKHVAHQGLDAGDEVRNRAGDLLGYEKVALFKVEYGTFSRKVKDKSKTKKVIFEDRPETAEELCTRIEAWMKIRRKIDLEGKVCVVIDSITTLSPEEELVAGLTDQNMRTRSSPAVFLNLLSKRWIALAENTNAIIILIAQLRTNPKTLYGNPDYVPGGNGILYNPSSVVWMRRVKGGEILRHGRQVGTKGVLTNHKNKVGGGSIERKKSGYKALFYKDAWEFMDPKEVEKDKEIE